MNVEQLINKLEKSNTPVKDLEYAEEQIHRFLPSPDEEYWDLPRIEFYHEWENR